MPPSAPGSNNNKRSKPIITSITHELDLEPEQRKFIDFTIIQAYGKYKLFIEQQRKVAKTNTSSSSLLWKKWRIHSNRETSYSKVMQLWLFMFEKCSHTEGRFLSTVIDTIFVTLSFGYFCSQPNTILSLLSHVKVDRLLTTTFIHKTFADVVAEIRIVACCHIPLFHKQPISHSYKMHLYHYIVAYLYLITFYESKIPDGLWKSWCMHPSTEELQRTIRCLRLVSKTTQKNDLKEKERQRLLQDQQNQANYGELKRAAIIERIKKLQNGEITLEQAVDGNDNQNKLIQDYDGERGELTLEEMHSAANGRGYDQAQTRNQLEERRKQLLYTYDPKDITLEDNEFEVNRGILWNLQPGDIHQGLLPLVNCIFYHYERDKYIIDQYWVEKGSHIFDVPIHIHSRFMKWMMKKCDEASADDSLLTPYQHLFLQSCIPMGAIFHKYRNTNTRMDQYTPIQLIGKFLGIETAARLNELKDIPQNMLLPAGEDHWMFPYFIAQKFDELIEQFTLNSNFSEDDDSDARSFKFLKKCYISSNNPMTLEGRIELLKRKKLHTFSKKHDITIWELNRELYVYNPQLQRLSKVCHSKSMIYACIAWSMLTVEENQGILCYSERTLKRDNMYYEFLAKDREDESDYDSEEEEGGGGSNNSNNNQFTYQDYIREQKERKAKKKAKKERKRAKQERRLQRRRQQQEQEEQEYKQVGNNNETDSSGGEEEEEEPGA